MIKIYRVENEHIFNVRNWIIFQFIYLVWYEYLIIRIFTNTGPSAF